MNNENIDNKLVSKVMDLCLFHSIEESDSYLKFLDNQIKVYQSHLELLKDTKPFFFQKKKLKEHNKKIEEYEKKINEIYLKIEQEVEEVNTIVNPT